MNSFITEHPRATFWIQFVIWVSLSLLAPVIYLIVRFNLFTTGSMTFGIWGMIVVIIVAIFFIVLLNYMKQLGKTEWHYWLQIVEGITKIVIPLLAIVVLLYLSKSHIEIMIEVAWVILACESVAIFFNPMPKLCFDKKIEMITLKDLKSLGRKE